MEGQNKEVSFIRGNMRPGAVRHRPGRPRHAAGKGQNTRPENFPGKNPPCNMTSYPLILSIYRQNIEKRLPELSYSRGPDVLPPPTCRFYTPGGERRQRNFIHSFLVRYVVDYSNRLIKFEWEVRTCGLGVARELVSKYHYARSATKTGVYTHGLFRRGGEECLGVAWWLPPTKNAAASVYPDHWAVLSLTRLVIHPSVPPNACSFLLSRSVKLIDKDRWKCLVTYADTWQGHKGTVYRACNWEYLGLTSPPSEVWVDKDGKMMGKKRGRKNLTSQQMLDLGFKLIGKFAKHKFKYLL